MITGVTGQDGWYLSDYLNSLGYEVFGLVRRCSQGCTVPQGVEVIEGDITDLPTLPEVDEIYNLAAMSHVGESFKNPRYTFRVDAMGPIGLLEHAKRTGAKFYQASTSELFGTSPPPQNEGTPLHPRSPYGVAKLAAYWMTVNYREAYGLPTYNGILFNHESPRRGGDFVTQKVCRGVAAIYQGEADHITLGNLEAKRDWGDARDYVKAMHLMVQNDPGEYVVATGKMYSIRDLLYTAFNSVGIWDWRPYVRTDARFLRPAEVPELCGDASKIRALGWEPEIGFEQMIKEMVAHALHADH